MQESEGKNEGDAGRREVVLAEIERDSTMVVLGLLRRLAALQTEQLTRVLACGRVDDPIELCEEVEAVLAASRENYRRLNDARIMRRGRTRSGYPTTPGMPAKLRAFARHGEYAGAYERLGPMVRAMAAEMGIGLPGEDIAGLVDLDGMGVEMHLQGELWTIEESGEVHVFRARETGGSGDGDPAESRSQLGALVEPGEEDNG